MKNKRIDWAIVFTLVASFINSTLNAQSVSELSSPRRSLASTSIENKVFFAGGDDDPEIGVGPEGASDVVDIYDTETSSWTLTKLSEARRSLTATSYGNYAFFAGGINSTTLSTVVDIYDADLNIWTVEQLSEPRYALASVAAEGKVFFAGGFTFVVPSSVVDIYDIETKTWSSKNLSVARGELTATTLGGKVFFAGGDIGGGPSSDVVDVYDILTDKWSVERLSVPAWGHSATTVGNLVMFAGGTRDRIVDIYNVSNDSWSTENISDGRIYLAAANGGGKAYFGGGLGGGEVSYEKVDIYDFSTKTWSTENLSIGRDRLAATQSNNQIFMGGGGTEDLKVSNVVDIFDADPSSLTNIIRFYHPKQAGDAVINEENKTVTLEVSNTVDYSKFAPVFYLAEGAHAYINEIEQVSGETESDYTRTTKFKVIAQDGITSEEWEIRIVSEDYFWVGNGGSWNDLSHWATESGGSVLHTKLPGIHNDVYFDENSFSLDNQIVEVPDLGDQIGFYSKNLDWSGVTNSPTFKIAKTTEGVKWISNTVNGNLVFDENMMLDFSGAEFLFTGEDYIIDTKSKDLGTDSWVAIGFSYDMNDISNSICNIESDIISDNGVLFGVNGADNKYNSNGHSFLIGKGYFWVRGLEGVNNIIDITGSSVETSSLILDKPISGKNHVFTLNPNLENKTTLNLKENDLEKLIINNSHSSISSPGSVEHLTVQPGAEVTISSGIELTLDTLIIEGTLEMPIKLNSSISGDNAVIIVKEGEVLGDFVVIQDNTATGGAVFELRHSWNNGNVEGWDFICVEEIALTIEIENEVVCQEGNEGTIKATATGSLYDTYTFSIEGEVLENKSGEFTDLFAGNYIIAAKDTFNCTIISEISLVDAVDPIWYEDLDGDGFGNAESYLTACVRPEGYVETAGDANDNNELITGVFDLNNSGIHIYPNPIFSHIVIELHDKLPVTVLIYSLEGKLEFKKLLSSRYTKVNTASLSPGMYYLVIQDGSNSYRKLLNKL